MKRIATILAIALLAPFSGAEKPHTEDAGKRTAPYFVVESGDGVESFPLLETEAKVHIAGVIANVHLTQAYKNSGDKTIEAVYVFPLGTGSAIHAMQMRIADRTIEAQIQETEKARQIYEAAKEEGKVASLLEQKRPNVFRMNVANIMPGDVVNVTVEYTELLVPEEGTYEYVFPTVVGPRFTGESSDEKLDGEDDWLATPHTKEGEAPSYAFHINVSLETGIPITKLDVPSHSVNVSRQGDAATVELAPEERKAGNKDFVLRYSLQGEEIQSGLVLYPGEDESFFLLMMEPPATVAPAMIPPREYVFVVDVSGSMNGFPLNTAKVLVENMVRGLREGDHFNILFFAGGSNVLSDRPLPATEENIEKALRMLQNQRGGGGTRILDALQKASRLKKREGISRSFIAVTDGYVSVEEEAFDLIREGMGGANVFAFGIGSSVNRYLIEGLARVGNGKPFVVIHADEAQATAERFMNYVRHPLLTDIEVKFDGFDAYDVEPPSLPDLFSERPLILFGKYRSAEGAITVTGKTASGDFRQSFDAGAGGASRDNVALRYLWARKRLETLSDYAAVGSRNRDRIVEIGLHYHLMTRYTSFVAVDTVVRDTGETVTVKQPLPLPEGVSNLAVGGAPGVRRMAFGGAVHSRVSAQMPAGLPPPQPSTDAIREEIRKPAPAKRALSITGAGLPRGVMLAPVEKALFDQLGEKLEKRFAAWDLTRLTVELTVDKGNITGTAFPRHKGKTFDAETLAELFHTLSLPKNVTGTVKLTLVYL